MKKIKEYISSCKKEVIVSLITMFILYIMSNLLNYIKIRGQLVMGTIIDYIYYTMAGITELKIMGLMITLFAGIALGISLFHVLDAFVLEKLLKQGKEKTNLPRNKKILSIISIVDAILILIYALSFVYCVYETDKFNRQMTAIKPYVTQEKYDILRSEWVTMISKKDYKKIKEEIIKIENKHLIKKDSKKSNSCKNNKD